MKFDEQTRPVFVRQFRCLVQHPRDVIAQLDIHILNSFTFCHAFILLLAIEITKHKQGKAAQYLPLEPNKYSSISVINKKVLRRGQ